MWAWLKRGFTPENIVQTTVSLIVALGVPALIRVVADVSAASLLVAGLGSACLVFGALLIVRARSYQDLETRVAEEVRKGISGVTFTVGPALPLGARPAGVPPWYVSNEGEPSNEPGPHLSVALDLASGESNVGARRIACEVSDPDIASHAYRFWKTETATYHLPERTSFRCNYPNDFISTAPDHEEKVPLKDGHHEVRWWKFDEVGGRELLATDGFDVRDGGVVES